MNDRIIRMYCQLLLRVYEPHRVAISPFRCAFRIYFGNLMEFLPLVAQNFVTYIESHRIPLTSSRCKFNGPWGKLFALVRWLSRRTIFRYTESHEANAVFATEEAGYGSLITIDFRAGDDHDVDSVGRTNALLGCLPPLPSAQVTARLQNTNLFGRRELAFGTRFVETRGYHWDFSRNSSPVGAVACFRSEMDVLFPPFFLVARSKKRRKTVLCTEVVLKRTVRDALSPQAWACSFGSLWTMKLVSESVSSTSVFVSMFVFSCIHNHVQHSTAPHPRSWSQEIKRDPFSSSQP